MKQKLRIIKWAFVGFLASLLVHSFPVGCNKDDHDPPQEPTPTLDLNKANKAAEDVELAFATGDFTKVLPFMATVALERSKTDLEAADPEQLKQFAIDFNMRSVIGHGDEFIEYQFNWNGIPYTVDFAVQEDGSIKIIRL
jgi:hypothetical protein